MPYFCCVDPPGSRVHAPLQALGHTTIHYTPDTCSHYHALKDFLTPAPTAQARTRLRPSRRTFGNYFDLWPRRRCRQDLRIVRAVCGLKHHTKTILRWPRVVASTGSSQPRPRLELLKSTIMQATAFIFVSHPDV